MTPELDKAALEAAKDALWYNSPLGSQINLASAIQAYKDEAGLVDRSLFTSFVDSILHGDDEHWDWLMECRDNALAGKPVPPPRGQGRAESAEKERDEARLARDELHAAQHREYLQVKELGKQLAALREALDELLIDLCKLVGPLYARENLPVDDMPSIAKARAALTDTAKAAALYQRVSKGFCVVPVEPTEKMLKPYDGTGIIPPRNTRALAVSLWKAMLAAAPVLSSGLQSSEADLRTAKAEALAKAEAKPEAGEGTEQTEKSKWPAMTCM